MMENIKEIPYGIANFVEVAEQNMYYVDKTMYLPLLEKQPRNLFFIRPRRFGKSIFLSMLRAYYDIAQKEKFQKRFGNLWIGSRPTPLQGKFQVVYLDFSRASGGSGSLEENFNNYCGMVMDLFGKVYEPYYFPGFAQKMEEQPDFVSKLNYLNLHAAESGMKLYLIIDEYDNFTNQLLTAYNDPLYEEVTTNDSFLRTFFKVIKAGIGEGSIRTCFCTGVLPVTMDDLTSGYNIAEILTLEPGFMNMLGFTYEETEVYLRYVLDKYSTGQDRYNEIWQLIVSNYDGYRFRPNGDRLFNATILTYFFKKFAANAGSIPDELVDENLRTDINWIRRLTLSLDNAKAMLDALVIDDELSYNVADLSSKFNKKKFFDKEFYPISLFYLGMTTLKNSYRMVLPNLTMRSVYMDYYNQLNRIEGNAQRYVPTYERYDADRRLEPLVQNYFEQYLGQFPAQVFDKMNENFIRCSFYELVSRYLSSCYTFAIEQNNSVGRSDFEMTGIPGTDYYTDDRVVEFKYYRAKEAEKMLTLTEPLAEHIVQVKKYGEDTKRKFPNYHVRTYVVYICANKGWKCWEV